VEVEQAAPIRQNFIYDSEEFQVMIERAMVNPEAIICGTLYSYKVN